MYTFCNMLVCDSCRKDFDTLLRFLDHIIKECKKMKCCYCGRIFSRLNNHLKKTHDLKTESIDYQVAMTVGTVHCTIVEKLTFNE